MAEICQDAVLAQLLNWRSKALRPAPLIRASPLGEDRDWELYQSGGGHRHQHTVRRLQVSSQLGSGQPPNHQPGTPCKGVPNKIDKAKKLAG